MSVMSATELQTEKPTCPINGMPSGFQTMSEHMSLAQSIRFLLMMSQFDIKHLVWFLCITYLSWFGLQLFIAGNGLSNCFQITFMATHFL